MDAQARVAVVGLTRDLVSEAVSLQAACFPPPFDPELLWKAEHLVSHLDRFPEGQFAAIVNGVLAGTASSLIISEEVWQAHLGWDRTVGGHCLENHTPDGSTLYGVDISVHPAYRGIGVARCLYEARFNLVRTKGLRRYGTAVRMPDYLQSGFASVADYSEAVARGERSDRTLTPMLRMGLALTGVIEDYMNDKESGNAAALLEWLP